MPKMITVTKVDPKEEILLAAEHILSASGVSAATVRAITTLADVNTAAISYYFGSRDDLFDAVCARRMQPANRKILRTLEGIEERDPDATIEQIFTPLVDTALNIWIEDSVLRAPRTLIFFSPETSDRLNASQMSDVYHTMRVWLTRTCPYLTEQQVRQRFRMAIGAIMNQVFHADMRPLRGREKISTQDLVSFISGGFGR